MDRKRSIAWDAACFVSGALPACWAAARATMAPDGAHVEGAARALALGSVGPLRALDAAWSALFVALPIGTRAYRAGLASAAALAVLGVIVFALAQRLLAGARLAPGVAMIASLLATLAPCAQIEGAAPAGSVIGACLALAPLALAPLGPRAVAFALGLALSYELDVLACALAALIVLRPSRAMLAPLSLGLAPLALLLARPLAPMRVDAPLALLGEGALRAWESGRPPLSSLVDQLGFVVAALALGGAALGVARKQKDAIALALVAVLGLALTQLGAPAGPSRFAPCVIAAVAAAAALSATAVHELALRIARVPVPYAQASSIMVLLFALALPFKTLDDTAWLVRDRQGAVGALTAELSLAPRALVVTPAPAVSALFAALRASGELAPDVLVLSPSDTRALSRAVLRDATLAPLARDVVLTGAPREYALTTLAVERPVYLVWDPRWDRALARHLVPSGPLDRYIAEPRGASDRKRALDAFGPARDRLARATASDPELRRTIASLLRARVLASGVAGDRDTVARTVGDLRRFAPNDAASGEVVKRIVLGQGPIDVADLRP